MAGDNHYISERYDVYQGPGSHCGICLLQPDHFEAAEQPGWSLFDGRNLHPAHGHADLLHTHQQRPVMYRHCRYIFEGVALVYGDGYRFWWKPECERGYLQRQIKTGLRRKFAQSKVRVPDHRHPFYLSGFLAFELAVASAILSIQ